MAGPRLAQLTAPPHVPDQVTAFNQSHAPSPARIHCSAIPSIEPATDDWPFLYMRDRHIPRHYVDRAGDRAGRVGASRCLPRSGCSVGRRRTRRRRGRGSSSCSAPASCCSRPSRSSSSRCCGDRPGSSASLAIASVLVDGAHRQRRRRAKDDHAAVGWSAACCVALLALNYLDPDRPRHVRQPGRRVALLRRRSSSARSSAPACCSDPRSRGRPTLTRDYGINLLGAMVGGVGEYLSLVTGFRALLIVIAICYLGAVAARGREAADSAELALSCQLSAFSYQQSAISSQFRAVSFQLLLSPAPGSTDGSYTYTAHPQ